MRNKALWLALGVLLMAAGPLVGEQITRVGILDIDKVYAVYFRESQAVKEFQQKRIEVLRDIARIDEEILELENRKLEVERRGEASEALRLDNEIFKKRQYREDFRRIKMDQLRRMSEKLYQSDEFLDELLQAIQFVAESEGFSLILNSGGQSSEMFLFFTKEIDITEKVIQELMRRSGQSYSPQG
ncbi:MAG: OmpH family outer membrane protein [Spirochaetales bacterium]|nr:OmpH family outer membrane protein [Spirochaetales bacterium]